MTMCSAFALATIATFCAESRVGTPDNSAYLRKNVPIVADENATSGSGVSSTADDIARYESGGQLAADPAEVPVDAPKDMKLILCIGQSNMAGRAKPTDEDRAVVANAYKLNRDNKWVVAKSPYHFDRTSQRVLATRYHEEYKKCVTR